MKPTGIMGKLWLAMLLLVVLVLGLSALLQAGVLEKVYYRQQASRLLEEGERLAGMLVEQGDPYLVARQVDLLARLMNASVMVVDSRGLVEHWQATGMMGHGMMQPMGGPGKGLQRYGPGGNRGGGPAQSGTGGSQDGLPSQPGSGGGRGGGPPWQQRQSTQPRPENGVERPINPLPQVSRGAVPGDLVPFNQEQISRVLAGQQVVSREHNSFFNTDVIVAGLPLQKEGQVLGALFIHAPVAPMAANLKAMQNASIYALMLGVLAATLLSLVFSRTLTRPLVQMNKVARAMAAGDFSCQLAVRSRDEMGVLAESLNTLSRELQEKIAALQKLDATRKEFVANVSHELRTPLTVMQGYTEALLDGLARDESQRREYLKNILEEILRLRRLVNDLLDLRRMEAGRITLNRRMVDMELLVNQVVERFAGMAAEKGVELNTRIAPGVPPVAGDGDRLAQVLINLVDNGLKVTPGGGRVEVELRAVPDGVAVTVTDTGPGIPPGELPLIWERFYKGDPARQRREGGSGLGLAIARQIVELHGGRITVHSEPGKGAAFTIFLKKGSDPQEKSVS
ncbi:HAMP domain-containing protein [Desulfofundulus thermobenzoicus]|uniref:histidine kinase n=1 Tax=Desulfofundulus thermobenzoicus TaxID=29376 RepID=A0A6N7IMK1_9FIRM|nr:ATP-binding protein [Desulfofundulus thermobenzoicus]MQL51202.1 HAMP domain-containing protein [Desulfofundulus thermobenzoicus]HHW43651.1 cell wall metabolism sensor histidine kinase WalK [Desulfotomaculum sp.]